MKKVIQKTSFLIVVLTLFTIPVSAQKIKKKDIKKMCVKFEQAILSKNYKKSLTFFEPEYKKEQHDGMLSGRTNQFLTEYLAGYQKGEKRLTIPKLSEIKSIKFKKIKINSENNEAEAILKVKLKDGRKLKASTIIYLKSKTEIYLIGGVG